MRYLPPSTSVHYRALIHDSSDQVDEGKNPHSVTDTSALLLFHSHVLSLPQEDSFGGVPLAQKTDIHSTKHRRWPQRLRLVYGRTSRRRSHLEEVRALVYLPHERNARLGERLMVAHERHQRAFPIRRCARTWGAVDVLQH